jgi:hypothetical protein
MFKTIIIGALLLSVAPAYSKQPLLLDYQPSDERIELCNQFESIATKIAYLRLVNFPRDKIVEAIVTKQNDILSPLMLAMVDTVYKSNFTTEEDVSRFGQVVFKMCMIAKKDVSG